MIPVCEPSLSLKEYYYVFKALRSNWLTCGGEFVNKFEQGVAEYHNAKYGIALSSGTAALHMALLALGIGKGDEVIVPSLSFVAVASMVKLVGAIPIIVDINRDDWLINTKEVEKAITKKTKAIIPVHLYGNVCNMNSINSIASKCNINVIEDTCEAIGTPLTGTITCLSFQSTKTLCTGEGGMCITNDKQLADKIRFYKDHAMTTERKYYHTEIGYNYRMCLPSGTKVSTIKKFSWGNQISNGKTTRLDVKSIELIKVGDSILTFNEKTGKKEVRKVIGTSTAESNSLIKLSFSNGNELVLTPNHPIYIHNKGWIRAEMVSVGSKVIQYKYRPLWWRLHSIYKRNKSLEEILGKKRASVIKKAHGARISQLRTDPNSSYNTSKIFNSKKMRKKQGETMRRINKERNLYPPERRAKIGANFKTVREDPNSAFNNPEACKRKHRAISASWKKRIKSDPEFAEERRRAGRELAKCPIRKPTSLELELTKLLRKHIPNTYKYVGNGKFWIENANPDFINVNGYKKAIEIYTPYWKIRDYGSVREYQKQRSKLLASYGWDILFLEAKRKIINPDLVIKKILDFTYNPNTEIVSIVKKETIKKECTVYNLEVEQNNNFFAFGILVHNSELQGAIGVAQLERLDKLLSKKNYIYSIYSNILNSIEGTTLQKYNPDSQHWVTAILVEPSFSISRDKLMLKLKEVGIETRVMFYPIHLQPPYVNDSDWCPVTTELSSKGMYLPSGVNLKRSQVEYICKKIMEIKHAM